jgi:hypothetical protein
MGEIHPDVAKVMESYDRTQKRVNDISHFIDLSSKAFLELQETYPMERMVKEEMRLVIILEMWSHTLPLELKIVEPLSINRYKEILSQLLEGILDDETELNVTLGLRGKPLVEEDNNVEENDLETNQVCQKKNM